jgi:hypothetical protein
MLGLRKGERDSRLNTPESATQGSSVMSPAWRMRFYTAIFVGGLVGGSIGLIRLHRWISHCQREAKRCADQARKWEETAKTCKWMAEIYAGKAKDKPQESTFHLYMARRNIHLAGQATKIASLFRAEEPWWQWWVGTATSRDYQAELWRGLE